jgi:GDP-4-dehydro-6-deoxy-D-mannose reductase
MVNAGPASARPGPTVVTGAAGFAGSHLVDLLVSEHADVIACRRPGSAGGTRTDVTWHDVDLLDAAAVHDFVARVKPAAIYHCAGAPHVASSWTRTPATLAANVMTTYHVLAAVRRAAHGCRVLVPGSAMVYRSSNEALTEDSPLGPSSPYALSKLAQEMLGRRAHDDDGADVVLTRPFNHIGPRQHPTFVASAVARQLALIEAGAVEPIVRLGNVDTRRDLTDVRDTVRAYQALMDRGRSGVVYNVCAGRAVPIRDLVRELVSRANVRVEIRTDPALLRPNDTPIVLGDARRLREETGWTPRIPMEQTLADLLTYWRGAIRG